MKKIILGVICLLGVASSALAYPGEPCNFDTECGPTGKCQGSRIHGKVCVYY